MTTSQNISWSDQWLVGFKKLDDEHQDIVNLIQRMQEAPLHELEKLLDQFELSARLHFDVENTMMEETQFPPRQCHIDEHHAVLKSVDEVRELMRQGLNPIAHDLVKELAKWFPAHVIHLDSALSHWMNKQRMGGKPVVIRRSLDLHHV
jgi:hemerythrin